MGGGGGQRSNGGNKKRKDNNGLEKHIEAIKKQLQNMRPYFSLLPQRICNAANKDHAASATGKFNNRHSNHCSYIQHSKVSTPRGSAFRTFNLITDNSISQTDTECWNGSEKTRNLNSTVSENGGRLRPSRPSKAQRSLVSRQMDLLRIIIKKLQLAYDGKTVEWGTGGGVEEDSGSHATVHVDGEGSGDCEGSGAGYPYGGSGDERHPDDPDLEGGDDNDDV